MTFVDDNNNFIDFGGDFAITKQAISFFNFIIKGDVSATFSIDNNSINRKILGYNGPKMVNQVAFSKQPFKRTKNGNIIDNGYIIIQSETLDSLKCFYISGNSNWINLLNGLISDLNWEDYNVVWDGETVISRFNSTEGIVFPMADWWSNLQRGFNYFYMGARRYNSGAYVLTDETSNEDGEIADFYPCIYLKDVIRKVCEENNIKVSGTLINEGIYNTMAIPPFNGKLKRKEFKDVNLLGSTLTTGSISGFNFTKYNLFTAVTNTEGLWSNTTQKYTANKKSLLIFYITSVTNTFIGSGIGIFKNNVEVLEKNVTYVGQQLIFKVLANPGDVFEVYIVSFSAGARSDSYKMNMVINVPVQISISDYVNPSHFLPKLTGLDIFKFLIQYFGCSVYFDLNSGTVQLNLLERFKLEDSDDWSSYYLSHEIDYTILSAKNNYIRNNNPIEDFLINYNNQNLIGYGEGNIVTSNELVENKDLFKIPFSPSGFGINNNGSYMTTIPLVTLEDTGDPLEFTGITGPTLGRYSFTMADTTLLWGVGEIARIQLTNGVNMGYFVSNGSAFNFTTEFPFKNNETGFIYKQKAKFNEVGPRIISVQRNILFSRMSSTLNGNALWNASGYQFSYDNTTAPHVDSSQTNTSYAIFCKSVSGLDIDLTKDNLAFENPIGEFKDPTIKELYFNKISNIFSNPLVRVTMLLPDSIYQSFIFDQFIYLKSQKLNSYFFVDSIENYVDGNTPVIVNLYML